MQTNNKVACLACRDKKLKCDKLLPTCTRCLKKSIQCTYVQHKKTGPKPSSESKRRKLSENPAPPSLPASPQPLKHYQLPPIPVFPDLPQQSPFTSYRQSSFSPSSPNQQRLPSFTASSPGQTAGLTQTQAPTQTPTQAPTQAPTPTALLPLYPLSASYSPLSIPEIFNTDQQEMKPKINDKSLNDAKNPIINTSLNNITTRSFIELIGLPKLGLTMRDIDTFHAFYFNSTTRIFKYSVKRYYHLFLNKPLSILHYSYMIWTIAAFYIEKYEHLVEKLYDLALMQMNTYWELNRDSFHSDILTYLHAQCLKAQFEFLSGREMRAALTVSASIRLAQMYGYDQIDLSPTTLDSPAVFFRNFSLNDNFENSNVLLNDDGVDQDIPLVEERRRVLWEVYAIDKWSSLVTGLPCALSVDSLSVIFTKLPSPTTFLKLIQKDGEEKTGDETENEKDKDPEDQTSYFLHEAMQKLDNNQVLLDINSSSSKILLLTISENIIKWCKMFLNMVELETLKSDSSINSIRNKVNELVKNFESMHNNLLFFDLTTEPLMNIVITNTSTLLYQTVLIKFSSLFNVQLKEDPSGATIFENEITLFKEIHSEVSSISEKLVLRFIKKPHMEVHLKKAPVFIVFINSIKSLFQCIAFIYKFNHFLHISDEKKNSLLATLAKAEFEIGKINLKIPIVEKTRAIIKNGKEMLDHSPQSLSFFDSFFDSAKTY